MSSNKNLIKKHLGELAATFVLEGMQVGLGSGTTAAYFIEALGKRCQNGLSIQAIASSENSKQLAQKHQIPLIDPTQVTSLDLTVDGADEIDPMKRMIKGGGGALLREKILASISQELIIIVDESKQVSCLGAFPLPLEIAPFAPFAIQKHLEKLGLSSRFRKREDGAFFITDNHNLVLDLSIQTWNRSLEILDLTLKAIPGVLETGLFLSLAGRVLTGQSNGTVAIS